MFDTDSHARHIERYRKRMLFNSSKKQLRKTVEYTGATLSDGVHASGGNWRVALGSGDSDTLDDESRYLRVQIPFEMDPRNALEILDLIRGCMVTQIEEDVHGTQF